MALAIAGLRDASVADAAPTSAEFERLAAKLELDPDAAEQAAALRRLGEETLSPASARKVLRHLADGALALDPHNDREHGHGLLCLPPAVVAT